MAITRFAQSTRWCWQLGLVWAVLSLSTVTLAEELKPMAPPVAVVPAPPQLDADVNSEDADENQYQHTTSERNDTDASAPIADSGAEMGSEQWEKDVEKELAGHVERGVEKAFSDKLIPALAVIAVLWGPIILIIVLATLRSRGRARREKMYSDNIARLLDAGRDVPLELLLGIDSSKAQNNLRKGIENVCVGLAVLVFLTLLIGIGIGSVGFIIMGYGISQLAIWRWIDSKEPQAPKTVGLTRD